MRKGKPMPARTPALTRCLFTFLRRLHADRGGNILMLTGGSILILALAIGFGIDYSRAQRLQTKLNAAADAAVLAAVDPAMLGQTAPVPQLAAQQMFNQQVAGLPGLSNLNSTVVVNDNSSGSLGTLRTATITFTASSVNSFAGILRMPTLPISGSATASASQPPSMNFYVAMDTSPSMLLPTTSTGITNLKAGAWWSGETQTTGIGPNHGCDFACHATNMFTWNNGVYVIDANNKAIVLNNGSDAGTNPFYRIACNGTGYGNIYDSNNNLLGSSVALTDVVNSKTKTVMSYCTGYNSNLTMASNPLTLNYTSTKNAAVSVSVSYPDTLWLVQNYAVVNPGSAPISLRTDAESDAAVSVIQYAYQIEQQYAPPTTGATAAQIANAPIYKMQFYTFNASGTTAALTNQPNMPTYGSMTDVASLNPGTGFPSATTLSPLIPASGFYTSYTSMLSTMINNLPASAGAGTQKSPQSVLILITDGALDDNGTIAQFSTANVNTCNTIKKNGTRIAVLYTQYIPDTVNYTSNSTFNNFANNNIPSIQSQLQACASQNADGTYLMQTVTTGGSVATALNTLFAMVVQSARLTQ
jgi:Flp pilus assembly protein TadG